MRSFPVARLGLASPALLPLVLSLSGVSCSSSSPSGFAPPAFSLDGAVEAAVDAPKTVDANQGHPDSTTVLGNPDVSQPIVKNGCTITDPDTDMDKDGWTTNQGDCNDCDPNVNPGAIDVLSTPDGGTPTWGDEDCDGTPGDSAKPCDTGLALDDLAPGDAAKAIELCAVATETDRRYGVLSATYMRADGTVLANPGLQVGLQPGFGPNVHPQGGSTMLVLSTGHARVTNQDGACDSLSCTTNKTGTPPTGFPQDAPNCPKTPAIADDVALEVQIRVPTNATGYSFGFRFYSFEYPKYVCDPKGYNDQFVALMTPAPTGSYVPTGSSAGNISFDSNHNPVSVNLGYFDVCDPSSAKDFAASCKGTSGTTCPALPSPYCPDGVTDLADTGFDVWNTKGTAGATRWLESQAPATPGSTITLRFALWDAGNSLYDSTVLIDNLTWIAKGATPVVVMTQPTPTPK